MNPADREIAERLAAALRCATVSAEQGVSAQAVSIGPRQEPVGLGPHLAQAVSSGPQDESGHPSAHLAQAASPGPQDESGHPSAHPAQAETSPESQREFVRLGAHLERSFPRVHTELELRMFGHSRLYRWAGAEPGVSAILLAHLDVVPADDRDGWTHPPFAGVVDDEFVWGRGAIDDKSRVLAILEAVEAALAAGVRPRQTVYLAFGHDEEAFGGTGAAAMAAHLRAEGVRADLLLDEGGVITEGIADGIDIPVAGIMVGEKGYATVRLRVSAVGGHSSMPGGQTAVGRIARAVARVQDHPMPLRMTPVVTDMLLRLRDHMPEARRKLMRFADYAGPLVTRVLAARPQTEALVRTTTAPTVIRGGVQSNVLPQYAEALVNFRILPGDSVAGVLEHCRRVVRDPGVELDLVGMSSEPSRRTGPGPSFGMIAELTTAIVPGIAVTTGIVPGATDSRYYDDLAETRCNFAPIVLTAADLATIHGTDERISLVNYARLIEFNRRLIDRLAHDSVTVHQD